MKQEDLLAGLSRQEKIRLLAGADFWHTCAITSVGLPAMRLSDGPSGVRGERSVGSRSVSFPCGAAIGATFDTEAAAALADALADECIERGVHVLLGPTINLHRHPLGGRHFESYSEDPVLTARLATAYVRALQARGVAATPKHLVANDTEFERHTISSDLPERVLRELYLVPFEAAVHDAGAWAVMASYNKLNGTYTAEHAGLLSSTVHEDWGFDGVVVSDWFGTHSTVASACAGLDLEMPGPPRHYGEQLARAVEDGEIPEGILDEHVDRLLTLALRTGAFGETQGRRAIGSSVSERQALARRLAAESFVLLKNEDALLPLHLEGGEVVAVVGPNALATTIQGSGSAAVNPVRPRSVLEALAGRLSARGVTVEHERGCVTSTTTPVLEGELRLEYFAASSFEDDDLEESLRHIDQAQRGSFTWLGEPAPASAALGSGSWLVRAGTTMVPEVSGTWSFSLVQVGTARLLVDGRTIVDAAEATGGGRGFFGFGSEEAFGTIDLDAGGSYEVVVEYTPRAGIPFAGLTIGAVPPLPSQEELLRRAESLAATADVVVCVVGTSAEHEREGRDRPSMELPGPQDALVRRVLAANPRTCVLVNAGAPVTMDWADDVPALAQIWFGGEQAGEGAADVLLGEAEPGGRLPTTIPRRLEDTPAYPYYPGEKGRARYGEGLLVGYRHYDTKPVQPRFCFGSGLSYTTFELSDVEVDVGAPLPSGPLLPGLEGPTVVEVTCTLANTGERSGSEVVQCYVHPLELGPGEPDQQLRAFAKTSLEAGSSRRLVLSLTARDFAAYEEEAGAFLARPGRYEIRLGRSSREIGGRATVELSFSA